MSKLFTPASIGNITLMNRLIMAPMQQRQGTAEAMATDYHVEHYSARAKGGVGLVIIESTSVSRNSRLFQDDIGIYTDAHIAPMKKIVDAVHAFDTPVFIQLCHGGRKSSPQNEGRMLAPSAIAFNEEYGTPEEMSLDDIQEAIRLFTDAARRSIEAGFDGIELHAAHGYLLHQFLSPLSNKRTDTYGGSLENRVRLIKEILTEVRNVIGKNVPVQIRLSASDYVDGGLTAEELGDAMNMLMPLGLDAVHVSTGGLLPVQPSEVYPGYQVPYAKKMKDYVSVPVIAVGGIHSAQLANEIVEEGKADFIAIGRPLLDDPNYAFKLNEELKELSHFK